MKNPYKVLGVSKNAEEERIRKAYRKLARKYHPDICKEEHAEARFKEITDAYAILSDADQRRHFDQTGQTPSGPPPGFRAHNASSVDMSSFFGEVFGSSRPWNRTTKGQDRLQSIAIDFLDGIMGCEHPVEWVDVRGKRSRIKVNIPPGAESGTRLRVQGQGHPPRHGGPCGDLMVTVTVRPHPFFRRHDSHLEMDLPITVLEALQGATIEVPTVSGSVKVTVPPKAQAGQRLRLRGKGVPTGQGHGDMILILRPQVPPADHTEILDAARVLETAYDDVRKHFKD
jgi:curved DNA-binding protein